MDASCEDLHAFLWAYLAQLAKYLLELKIFQTEVTEKN